MADSQYENRGFYGGKMNIDSAPEFVENGQYGRAFNIRPYNPETGSVGTVTNVEGNTLVEYDFRLTGNVFFRVVGSKLDLKRRFVYWFVYVNQEDNSERAYILRYSYETEQITTIFSYPNVLDFDKNRPIRAVDIVYDDVIGDTLLWVDGSDEPKKLNVNAAINRFNNFVPFADSYAEGNIVFANSQFPEFPFFDALNFIPFECTKTTSTAPVYNFETGQITDPDSWVQLNVGSCYPHFLLPTMFYQKPIAPYFSPISTFTYDEENIGVNAFLKRKTFQFAYKYVYFDGQESEWSPISEAVHTKELASAVVDATTGEAAQVEFPTPKSVKVRLPINILLGTGNSLGLNDDDYKFYPHSMVASVKVSVREVSDSKAPDDFRVFADIPSEEFWKYNTTSSPLSEGFPVQGESATYYFDWASNSFLQIDDTNSTFSRVVTMDVEYTGQESLIPVDIIDAATLFYRVPQKPNAQAVIDNRVVWGGGELGMDVSKEVFDSIDDHFRVLARKIEADINVVPEVVSLGTFAPAVITEPDLIAIQVNGYDATNFNQSFGYQFFINILFNVDDGFQITQESTLLNVSGVSSGIPGEFANWNAFISNVVESGFNGFPTGVTVTASGDNGNGDIFINLTSNLGDVEIVNVGVSLEGEFPFFRFQGYLPQRTIKNHTSQEYGISFEDETGRVTQVIETSKMSFDVDHFVDDDGKYYYYQPYIPKKPLFDDVLVPQEARVMNILRKRSGSYDDFYQFSISSGNCPEQSWNFQRPFRVGFLNLDVDDFVGSTPTQQDRNLYITLNSVNGGDGGAYNSAFSASVGGFTPQVGDVIRFLYRQDNDTGEVLEVYNSSFSINVYSDTWNTIGIDFRDVLQKEPELADFFANNDASNGQASFQTRILCEITKPKKSSDQEFYWEVATQIYCENGRPIVGGKGDINMFGDAFMKPRAYCIKYTGNPNTDIYQNFVLVDPSYNDFAVTRNVGEGRPNTKIKSNQSRLNIYTKFSFDALCTYSEQSVQNTDRRFLGTSYDANIISEFDNVFGRIEHLDSEGDILNVYQEDKRARVYAGRGITTELSGAERVIATQNNVFSDIMYQNGQFGISVDSTSFAKSGYRKYFTDRKRGAVYRESLDGITPISEAGLSGHFKRLFKAIRDSSRETLIRGFVDERLDEYILVTNYYKRLTAQIVSFSAGVMRVVLPSDSAYYTIFKNGDRFRVWPESDPSFLATAQGNQLANTVSFLYSGDNPSGSGDIDMEVQVSEVAIYSERTGGWTTFMSYDTEWGSAGIQSYHTFIDGQMYIHEIGNTDYNTFHGRQFPMSVEVHSNANPELTKYWLTTGIKTKAETAEMPEISTSESQESYIPNASFENREGTQWSEFYGEGEGEEVLEGDRLRGRWLKTKVEVPIYEANEEKVEIFSVVFNSKASGFTR